MLTLKIIGGVLALLLGIWLGLPGRYERRSEDEIAKLLEGEGRRKTTRKHFMYLDWFRKEDKASNRRRERRHFRTAAPRPRDAPDG